MGPQIPLYKQWVSVLVPRVIRRLRAAQAISASRTLEALLKLSKLPYTVLLMTPFVYVLTRVRSGPWPSPPAPWWVSVALAGWALYAVIVTAVLIERLFVRDPVAVAQEKRALTGTVILLSPVSAAWGCCFFGLPVAQLFCYAALSFVGVALWGWRYRRIIGYAA